MGEIKGDQVTKRLNLGAGNDIRNGWVNHDIEMRNGIQCAWDLNERPWPWENNTFDRIDAISVFEHLKLTLIETLDECWRILKPGGHLYIKYPVFTSPFIHHDPQHRWFWSEATIDFVDPATKYGETHSYYTDRKWKIVKKKANERNCWVTLQPIKGEG